MKISVPSENIIKLRELTAKLDKENKGDEYKKIVKKLKNIVDEGKVLIEKTNTPQSKIKCYESMCATITSLLANVKFI